jgi:hypothetical protein
MTNQGTRLHEAAHAVVGARLGFTSRGVTVNAGEYSNGVSRSLAPVIPAEAFDLLDDSQPFVTWPDAIRRAVEGLVIKSMAGDLAEELFTEREGRQPDPPAERIGELAAELPEPDQDDQARFDALVNDPGAESDDDQAARFTRAAFGDDLPSAAAWLAFCEAQARQLVHAEENRIRHLASVLELRQTLSAEAVVAVLREH